MFSRHGATQGYSGRSIITLYLTCSHTEKHRPTKLHGTEASGVRIPSAPHPQLHAGQRPVPILGLALFDLPAAANGSNDYASHRVTTAGTALTTRPALGAGAGWSRGVRTVQDYTVEGAVS